MRTILLAVDPVGAVVDEAADLDADLLVVHHPLLMRAVHGVPASHPKGAVLTRLIRAGCGLLTAHTNADVAADGVSASLADALGLVDQSPLRPVGQERDRLVTFVPEGRLDAVREALAEAGAGVIGDYDRCSFAVSGTGRFRALDGAAPTIGRVGEVTETPEVRLETVLPRARRAAVVRALRAAHPYDEPVVDLIELAEVAGASVGSGRIGTVAQTTLRAFADRVAEVLPPTGHGVRVSGDPDRPVGRVAVAGGSGDFLLDDVRAAGVDVYLTSDLRHHPASEFREWPDAPALIDVAHWAAEWTWLPVLAARMRAAWGDTVRVVVSTTPTDPWDFRA